MTGQGARVGKSGERLSIKRRDEPEAHVRLIDVSHVSVYGNVQVSAQALRSLAGAGKPILHTTYGGWLTAVTSGPDKRNVQLRVAQYEATRTDLALEIAREIVAGKIRNQRTILRRNHRACPRPALDELARLARSSHKAKGLDQLLGIEGMASRLYFSLFEGMLKSPLAFEFASRTRRPPTDPVNALLSFLYSLLAKDCTTACLAVALDPYVGLFHQVHYGRPPLALDLAEEFRPLIADSVVLSLVNNRSIARGDFLFRGPACALKDGARRQVIEAYEARLQTLVRHALFGYSVSYRRVLEVQARLLARVVEGELKSYKPFVTR